MDNPQDPFTRLSGVKGRLIKEHQKKLKLISKLQKEAKQLELDIAAIDTITCSRRVSESSEEIGLTPRSSSDGEIGPTQEDISLPATPENLVHLRFNATPEERYDDHIRHAFEAVNAPEELIDDLIRQYDRIEDKVNSFYRLNNDDYFMPILPITMVDGLFKLTFQCPNSACTSQKKKRLTLYIKQNPNGIWTSEIRNLRRHAEELDHGLWNMAVEAELENILYFPQRNS